MVLYLHFQQDDDDGHLTVLQVVQEVMNKGGSLFLDHFARLGLFGKVLSLAGPIEDEEGATGKDDKVKLFTVKTVN